MIGGMTRIETHKVIPFLLFIIVIARFALPAILLAGGTARGADVRVWLGDRAQLIDPPSVPPFQRTEIGGDIFRSNNIAIDITIMCLPNRRFLAQAGTSNGERLGGDHVHT